MKPISAFLLLCMLLSVTVSHAHEKLDVKEYQLHKPKNSEFKEFAKGDSIISYNIDKGLIGRRSIKKGETIKVHKAYNAATGQLIYKGKFLLDIPIGAHYSYTKQGKLSGIKEWEKGYTFTPYDVIKLILDKYKTDLTKTGEGMSLHRQIPESEEKKIYMVMLPVTVGGDYRLIKIDGTTGKIISDAKGYYIE